MIAYFVHNREKNDDKIIIPYMGCSVSVTPERFEKFISVDPSFSQWQGEECTDVKPEDFGTVLATRAEGEDVCILEKDLWRERLELYS